MLAKADEKESEFGRIHLRPKLCIGRYRIPSKFDRKEAAAWLANLEHAV